MNSISLLIKGFIMGIANIIPGVSGGTLALTLGIYEQLIHSISNFFKDFKSNIKFLILIGIGIVLAILTMSNVISWSYSKYPIATTLFFMGLIIGGIPILYKKVKGNKLNLLNVIIFMLSFALVIFMTCAPLIFDYRTVNFNDMNILNYVMVFIVGMIASATMIIPGISGSLVLMLLGYYYPIINLIKNILNLKNIIILVVFGIGVILGIVLISKLIQYLFNKHEKETYYGVLGFVSASVFAVIISSLSSISITFNIIEVIIGIVLLSLGCLLAFKLGEK